MSTWKCVIRFHKTGVRVPFYASHASKARHEAKLYLNANKIQHDSVRVLEPVEVFKQGVPYDTAV